MNAERKAKSCAHVMAGGPRKGMPCGRSGENGGSECFHHTQTRMDQQAALQRARKIRQANTGGGCIHILSRGKRKGQPCGEQNSIQSYYPTCLRHDIPRCSYVENPEDDDRECGRQIDRRYKTAALCTEHAEEWCYLAD